LATIYDVAGRAGVSPKTVSRFLNDDAPVGKASRKRIEDAIAALGYVPSSAARAMRSNRSGLVGLIGGAISVSPQNPTLSGLPDLYIVQGILRELENSGLTLMISDTGGRADRAPALMRTFLEHRVEGLLYVADHHKKVALPPTADGVKMVLVNCFDEAGTPAVLPDDRQGQRALTEGLITRGHRRIAYLTLSERLEATRLRTQGYREALSAAGIGYDPALVIAADLAEPDAEAETQLLWDGLDRALGLADPPTVLCFGNDRMAMRAYGMLRARGLRLPEDISLAGFDNYRLIAETLFPPLASVELPYAAMGVRAAQLLVALIRGAAAPAGAPQMITGPVVWRDSVVEKPRNLSRLSLQGRKPE